MPSHWEGPCVIPNRHTHLTRAGGGPFWLQLNKQLWEEDGFMKGDLCDIKSPACCLNDVLKILRHMEPNLSSVQMSKLPSDDHNLASWCKSEKQPQIPHTQPSEAQPYTLKSCLFPWLQVETCHFVLLSDQSFNEERHHEREWGTTSCLWNLSVWHYGQSIYLLLAVQSVVH